MSDAIFCFFPRAVFHVTATLCPVFFKWQDDKKTNRRYSANTECARLQCIPRAQKPLIGMKMMDKIFKRISLWMAINNDMRDICFHFKQPSVSITNEIDLIKYYSVLLLFNRQGMIDWRCIAEMRSVLVVLEPNRTKPI
jgi:hypothetical protein